MNLPRLIQLSKNINNILEKIVVRYCVKFINAGKITICFPGPERDRTADPLLAKQVLSQLSYRPSKMGPSGFEPLTPALSAQCSNQLSYGPVLQLGIARLTIANQSIVQSLIPQSEITLMCVADRKTCDQ